MQQERISERQIQEDIKDGVCKQIDGFYVYSDKVVQYTSHFGYTINRGSYYKTNGLIVTRATDKKRISIARLIAKAFLLDTPTDDFFVIYKDGNKMNYKLDNLEIQFKEQEKFCKICGTKLSRGNRTSICLDCKRTHKEILVSEKEILHRREKFKHINLDGVNPKTLDKLHLYLQGYSYVYIAEKYGVTRQSIEYTLKRLLDVNRKIRNMSKKDNKELILALQKAIDEKQKEIADLSYQILEKQKEMGKLIRRQNNLIN